MSSESNFSYTARVGQDLFTVRGDTLDEFHTNVALVAANAQALFTDLGILQAGTAAAPLVAPQAPTPPPPAAPPQQQAWPQQPAPQQWQQPAPPAQPVQPQGAQHLCKCGQPMALRNSQYGSFYSCAKPFKINGQLNPERCDAKVNV